MHTLIIYNVARKHTREWERQINVFIRSFRRVGVTSYAINNSEALDYCRKLKDYLSFVFMWDKDAELAETIERMGIPTFNNSYALNISRDRILTHRILKNLHLPTTKKITIPYLAGQSNLPYFERLKEEIENNKMSYPLVVKNRQIGINETFYLAKNDSFLKKILEVKTNEEIIVEEFVPLNEGKFFKLMVLGDKYLCGAERVVDGNFIMHPNGQCALKQTRLINKRMQKLAVKAAKAIEADFAAIEMVLDVYGNPLILEINAAMRTNLLEEATGVHIAKKIARYCKNNYFAQKRLIRRRR